MGEVAQDVLLICGLIAALAAAAKGTAVLYRATIEGARRAKILDDLTDEEGWPNGATSLKESHRDIYDRVAGIDLKVDELRTQLEELLTRPGR